MENRTEKIDSLQFIRAFAMLLVFFIHLDVLSTRILNIPLLYGFFTPGGDAGVNLFFVLSGFIIYYVHRHDINNASKSVPYLIKRFCRIYPTYWIANLVIIPFHFLFPQYGLGDETQLRTILMSLALFPQNHPPIIHSAWSLSYEMYYYLIFAMLILWGFKRLFPLLFFILLGTIYGMFYSLQFIDIYKNPWVYIIFSYHNFEFLLGCLSAYLVTKYKIKHHKSLLITGVLIYFLAIVYERFAGYLYSFRLFGYGIPAVMIIIALSSAELNKTFRISKSYLTKLFLLLGNASFSIYITHQFFISGIGRTLVQLGMLKFFHPYVIVGITGIIALAIGCLFYQIIERPLLYYSRTKLLSWYNTKL